MNKIMMSVAMALVVAGVLAEPGNAREAFLKRQAYDEMMRVSGQVDVLQTNLADISARLARLENDNGSKSEVEDLKAEIAALKASNAELRNRISSMQEEIVRDLTGKIAKMQKDLTPPAPPPPKQHRQPAVGPHREYEVQSGDTLSLIAAAFKTTVPKIKEMNNLKNDNIRVGQKLKLPM